MVFAWPRRKGSAILTCNLAMWRAEYRPATSSMPSLILRRKKELLYTWLYTVSLRKYISQKPFLRGLFLEGLIFGGHIYEGKFAWQNRLGLYWDRNLRLKIYWASSKLEKNLCRFFARSFYWNSPWGRILSLNANLTYNRKLLYWKRNTQFKVKVKHNIIIKYGTTFTRKHESKQKQIQAKSELCRHSN